MRLKDHDRELLLGITGSGKSHYAKRARVRPAPRVVVFDAHAEYADDCQIDEVSVAELVSEPDLLAGDRCRLAVVPDWDDPSELAEQFATFVRCLKEGAHEAATMIVVEECGLLRPTGDGTLVMLAAQARHWRMPLVLVAQRAMMVPPGVRAQVSRVVSFRQSDPDDIAALGKVIGQERAAKVATLPRRRFVEWSEEEAFNRGASAAR